jgi:type IV pilus assembly protein PilB
MAARNFTEILLRKGIVSLDQLSEAERMARETNKKPADCLIQLQYATGEEVMRAMAEHNKLEYVDLKEVSIPENVIELVPESVARANTIITMRVTRKYHPPHAGRRRFAGRDHERPDGYRNHR